MAKGLAKNRAFITHGLTAAGESCLVVTDEVGMGSSAARLRQSDESLMHSGHDLWLATLKWMAEGK